MRKRIFSVLLSLIMVVLLLPTTAFAASSYTIQKNAEGMESSRTYTFSINEAASVSSWTATPGDSIVATFTGTPKAGMEYSYTKMVDTYSVYTGGDVTPNDFKAVCKENGDGTITVTCAFTMPEKPTTGYSIVNLVVVCEEPQPDPPVTPTPSVSLTATSDEYTAEYDSSNYRFVAKVTDTADSNAALTDGAVQFYLNDVAIGSAVSYTSTYSGYPIVIATGESSSYPQFAMGDNTVKAVYTWTDETTTATSSDVTFTLTKKDISSSIAIGYTTSKIYYDGYETNSRAQVNVDSNQSYDDFDVDDVTITATLDGVEHTLSSTRKTDTWMTFSLNDAGTYKITVSLDEDNDYYTGTQSQEVTVNPLVAELEWSYDSIVFDGKEQEVTVSVTNAISGDTFEPIYEDNTATKAGEYTAKVTDLGNSNYTLVGAEDTTYDWEITQSGTNFGDGIVADQEDMTYTYGETMTFTVTPEATGETPENTGDDAVAMSLEYTAPSDGEMALYATIDDVVTQISDPATADDNGEYELKYETTDKLLAVGTHSITAKYVETDSMAEYSGTIEITIEAKPITATVNEADPSATKEYDGTTAFEDVVLTLTTDATATTADKVVSGDTVSATADGTRATADVTGSATFTATDITLDGTDKAFYSLSTADVSGDVAVSVYNIGTSDNNDSSIIVVMGDVAFDEPSFDGVTVDKVIEAATGTVSYTYDSTGYDDYDYDALILALNALNDTEDTVVSVGYTFTATDNYTGGGTGTLTVTLNVADPVYTVSGNTITATYDDFVGGTVYISVPTSTAVYDGSAADVSVVKTGIFTDKDITVTYTKDGVAYAGELDQTGSYVVTIVYGEEYTATASFSISKAPVSFTVSGNSFKEGSEPSVSISNESGLSENTDYTVTYLNDEGEEVTLGNDTTAGTYTIVIEVTNSNYQLSGTVGSVVVYADEAPATYTVSFGEDASEMAAAIATTVRTLPEANTNTGYTFTGWSYDGKVYAVGSTFVQPEENVVMEAIWVENTFTVSGTVYASNGTTPVSGVSVTLKDDTTYTTGADGTFSFSGVAMGEYNIVAEKDGMSTTTYVYVSENTIINKILLDITVKITVDVEAGLNTTTVSEFQTAAETVISENTYASGDTVEIKLVVASSNDTSAEDAIAAESEDVGYIMDITVKEIINNTQITNLSEIAELVEVTVDLPAEMQGMAYYTVLRYHEGAVNTLTTTASGEGECIVVNEAKTQLTVKAKYFSTYAITSSATVPSTGSSSNNYYIKATATGNGTVAPEDEDVSADSMYKVSKLSDVTFVFTPDSGYEVTDVIVNGSSVGVCDEYEFENILETVQTLEVVFEKSSSSSSSSSSDEDDDEDEDEDDDDVEESGLPFTDVSAKDDNYDGIAYVYENGIMAGISDDEFGGDMSITRGMIAAILYRINGSEPVDAEMTFADVTDDQYYYDAVAWGQDAGVVAGFSATEFAPDMSITNEQFAAFLYRYASSLGMDMTVEYSEDLSGFVMSDYAITAVAWALENDIIDADDLEPMAEALRGNVATALMSFMEMM